MAAEVVSTLDGAHDDIDSPNEMEGFQSEQKHGMQGMADVINKILAKPKPKVLKKKKNEVEKSKDDDEDNAKKPKLDRVRVKEINHVLPILKNDAVKEAMLKRVGTRGVVVLFNTVSSHQKAVAEKKKVAKTEVAKEKASKSLKKSSFMDMLKTGQAKTEEDKKIKDEVKSESPWDVFKDDFMLGSTLKHWDKNENNAVKKKKNESEDDSTSSSSDDEDDETT